VDDKKIRSGYVFRFGSTVVAWDSERHPIVTLSSIEEEYVPATITICQTMWMRRIMTNLLREQQERTQIFFDNKSNIYLSCNHLFHKKTKNIGTKYHFIRELINNGETYVEFCRSEDPFADMFANSIEKELFEILRRNIGFCEL